MSHKKSVFTRSELYELVWSTPIVKLAQEFGLSDKGFAKICQRNQIPVPGRGYWARLEAGQKITKTPLRKMYSPELETVHFERLKRAVNPYVAFAIEATKSAQRALADEEALHLDVKTKIEPESIRTVAKTKLHPSLQGFAREFQNATPDVDGTVYLRWIKVHCDSIPRVMAVLNALAYAFEPFGITFSASGSRVKFINDDTGVDFEITSPKKRVATDRGSWKSYENIYVGRLAVRIFGQAEGFVKTGWIRTAGRSRTALMP